MMRALRSMLCLAFGLSPLALLLCASGVAKAQEISCSEIGPYYTQRMSELTRQANACAKRFPADAPWTMIKDGGCSWWGPRACAGPVQQCSSMQSQYHQAQSECRRLLDVELDERRTRTGSDKDRGRQESAQSRVNSSSVMSSGGMRSIVNEPMQKFGEKYFKRFGWALIGSDSPFEYFQQLHERPVGLFMRGAYQTDKSWSVAKAAWDFRNALSGPKEKKDRALFVLANEAALRATSEFKDPGRMFSTFSFLLLKSMQLALLDELNVVSAQVALFGATDQMARNEQDIWYSAATARWADKIAARVAAAGSSAKVDMSTADLVNEVRARAAQIAAANAQAIKAQRDARDRVERAEREAREAQDEQNRRQAREAALRAQEQQLLWQQQQWEAEQEIRRRIQQQRVLNSIIGGVVSGLTSVPPPAPAPTYVPSRPTYPPAPAPSRGGGSRCPGATIAVDENCRPIR